MLSTSFMFQKLSPIQKDLIYAVMQLREVKNEEVIIREGDKGDEMYIVDR
jgi:CRP-like cAMP-binding protein